MRGVIQEVEPGLAGAAKKGFAGGVAEAGRNDDRYGVVSAPHAGTRFFERQTPDGEVLVLRHAVDNPFRDGAPVLVHHQDRNLRHFGVGAPALENEPEERRDGDRHGERHDDRAPIAPENLEVFPDHGDKWCEGHQSRRLLPVSVRNTDSSVSPPRVSPATVSLAITLP